MVNYSLVCWGGHEFNATNRLVFDRVLPGPCVLMSTCKCGVLAGSANLCAGGRCVCVDCAFERNVAIPKAAALTPGNDSSSRRRRKIIIWVAVGAAAFLLLVVAFQLALFLWCRRRRRRKDVADDLGALQSLMQPQLGSSRSRGPGSVVEHFTLDTLRSATEGFDDQRRIGSGSFGSVYRGTLPDGREVAIKRAEEHATKSSSSARPARRRLLVLLRCRRRRSCSLVLHHENSKTEIDRKQTCVCREEIDVAGVANCYGGQEVRPGACLYGGRRRCLSWGESRTGVAEFDLEWGKRKKLSLRITIRTDTSELRMVLWITEEVPIPK
jgi:hypothetical protein